MFAKKSPIQVIEHSGIEARIYQVQQGYRVELDGTDTELYWHVGVFADFQQVNAWLKFELEKLDAGLLLGSDWLMLEGDFSGNRFYRDWFICKGLDWQAYDPLTNRCYIASSLKELKGKIDRIEDERSPLLNEKA